ncbi:hypothetical protein KL905_000698 [Ogataea polymorpha]|uniref:uncharacterized protein n=1 Tax=Ogataea polymorpha TaxID=460523 RepID=UPI0007F36865|nr:uncharacterized protein OGAPODRAFT_16449 [Ogataea polymorpha]KAG7881817.1 hypothetical protein KL937_001440 [Ogataea polymorpha]KAG7890962.1 hypothetical protein KL936_002246 [Ogataea polymorpha]KAG7894109.1 hypothetical protein KL908_002386 [Ogataea polymorpha]KAG7902063.1 hypothetical protein KL935_002023 [Ogataea polymorpha]KAG7910580.1 hypothetical protein KL907_001471 [Ogataea polymorpha]
MASSSTKYLDFANCFLVRPAIFSRLSIPHTVCVQRCRVKSPQLEQSQKASMNSVLKKESPCHTFSSSLASLPYQSFDEISAIYFDSGQIFSQVKPVGS